MFYQQFLLTTIMTDRQHQLLRIAALELKKEEEARDAFLNAPSGPSTPQCISVNQVKRVRTGAKKWNKEELNHINGCSSCKLFVKLAR